MVGGAAGSVKGSFAGLVCVFCKEVAFGCDIQVGAKRFQFTYLEICESYLLRYQIY